MLMVLHHIKNFDKLFDYIKVGVRDNLLNKDYFEKIEIDDHLQELVV
jgi:hypothetical protein